jgi:hypothetical protein
VIELEDVKEQIDSLRGPPQMKKLCTIKKIAAVHNLD